MMNSRARAPLAGSILCVLWTLAALSGDSYVLAQSAAQPRTTVVGRGIDVPRIAYTRLQLRNGLIVLLHEDHSSPIAAVDIWYHVGSKDDVPGKRGLAHMYEHMMFEGSSNVAPGEFKRILQEAGSVQNAGTDNDHTTYVATVPSNMLETLLWLEADRMASAGSRLDSVRFDNERGAIRSEYNRGYDGAPANNGLAALAILGALFKGTIYESGPIGSMQELSTASVEDLRDFFNQHTAPNNAVIAIAGDFTTAAVRAMVDKYFAEIPRRPLAAEPTLDAPPLVKEARLVLEDRIANNSHLFLAWRGAATTSPDQLALAALSSILAGGPNARLPRALVTSLRIANAVSPQNTQHFDLEQAGIFQIAILGRPGVPMTNIEVAVDSVLNDIRENGIQPAELERWKTAFAVGSVLRLQTDSAKARLLAEGQTYHHDPAALLDQIDAARRLTPADIERVARQYLRAGRVVLSIVPARKLDLVSKPDVPYANVTRKTP